MFKYSFSCKNLYMEYCIRIRKPILKAIPIKSTKKREGEPKRLNGYVEEKKL